MSVSQRRPLRDRGNSRSPAPSPSNSKGKSACQRSDRYSLYPGIRSSETAPGCEVYEASLALSSSDENGTDSIGKQSSWRSTWLVTRRRQRTATETGADVQPQAPQPEPPERSPAPRSGAILETRYSNRPHGTPLTTIIEQRSSLSLRRKLSDISAMRYFIPIHIDPSSQYVHTTASQNFTRHERVSLSLDESAIRGFRKMFRSKTESGTGSDLQSVTTATVDQVDESEPGQQHQPTYPPFKRTKTPPGRPRWPGDLTPTQRQSRPSSSRVTTAVFDLFNPARSGLPQLPGVQTQRQRRSSLPRRVGRAYWQPPRSGYSTYGYENPRRHPFYNAPIARLATPDGTLQAPVTPLRKSSKEAQTSPDVERGGAPRRDAIDGTLQPFQCCTGPDPVDIPELTGVAFSWTTTEDLMADIVTTLNHTQLSPVQETEETTSSRSHRAEAPRAAVSNALESQSMTILPVRASSNGFSIPTHNGSANPTESYTMSVGLSPRDDPHSRYTADGVPIYRPDAASLRSVEERTDQIEPSQQPSPRHDSIHEDESAGTASAMPSAGHSAGEAQRRHHHIHWAENSAETCRDLHSSLDEHGSNRCPANDTSAEHQSASQMTSKGSSGQQQQETRSTRIVSAALPILLPIAEREGIVHPIRLQPHRSNSDEQATPHHTRRSSDSIIAVDGSRQGRRCLSMGLKRRQQCPHLSVDPLDGAGCEIGVGRVVVAVAVGKSCWRCKVERGMAWVVRTCFCQPEDNEHSEELETVRVITATADIA